jgi:hypothetical protein
MDLFLPHITVRLPAPASIIRILMGHYRGLHHEYVWQVSRSTGYH